VASTPEQLAMIEAQRAYFASDECVRERAALWRDATPEECLMATAEECAAAVALLEVKDPVERDRALEPPPIPADTVAILEALQRRAKR
jgi:hypothetical protein